MRVWVITTNGNLGAGDGTAGDGPAQLAGPGGVALTPSGALVIADTENSRVMPTLAGPHDNKV